MKKLITIIAIVLVVASVVFLVRSCATSAELKKAKADHSELKRIMEANDAILKSVISDRDKVIVKQNELIAEKDVSIARYVEKVSTLRGELTGLQESEPSQPELESEPLVINLRAQVSRLTEMFSLANNIIADREAQIRAWEVKFDSQVDISEAWKTRYENERTVRESAEGLFKLSEKRLRLSRTVTKVAIVVGGAYFGYRLVRGATAK